MTAKIGIARSRPRSTMRRSERPCADWSVIGGEVDMVADMCSRGGSWLGTHDIGANHTTRRRFSSMRHNGRSVARLHQSLVMADCRGIAASANLHKETPAYIMQAGVESIDARRCTNTRTARTDNSRLCKRSSASFLQGVLSARWDVSCAILRIRRGRLRAKDSTCAGRRLREGVGGRSLPTRHVRWPS